MKQLYPYRKFISKYEDRILEVLVDGTVTETEISPHGLRNDIFLHHIINLCVSVSIILAHTEQQSQGRPQVEAVITLIKIFHGVRPVMGIRTKR